MGAASSRGSPGVHGGVPVAGGDEPAPLLLLVLLLRMLQGRLVRRQAPKAAHLCTQHCKKCHARLVTATSPAQQAVRVSPSTGAGVLFSTGECLHGSRKRASCLLEAKASNIVVHNLPGGHMSAHLSWGWWRTRTSSWGAPRRGWGSCRPQKTCARAAASRRPCWASAAASRPLEPWATLARPPAVGHACSCSPAC